MVFLTLSECRTWLHNGVTCKLISKLCSVLVQVSPKPSLFKSKKRWEADLNITFEEEHFSDLCQDSSCARTSSWYRLIHYNFLHQLYLTPEKIHRSKLDVCDAYFQCAVYSYIVLGHVWGSGISGWTCATPCRT